MYFLYVQYYGSVSEAISSSKVEGQRIIIHPGVYNENIVLDRPVTLIGASRLLWQLPCVDFKLQSLVTRILPYMVMVDCHVMFCCLHGNPPAGPEKVLLVSSSQTVVDVRPGSKDAAICNVEIKVHTHTMLVLLIRRQFFGEWFTCL